MARRSPARWDPGGRGDSPTRQAIAAPSATTGGSNRRSPSSCRGAARRVGGHAESWSADGPFPRARGIARRAHGGHQAHPRASSSKRGTWARHARRRGICGALRGRDPAPARRHGDQSALRAAWAAICDRRRTANRGVLGEGHWARCGREHSFAGDGDRRKAAHGVRALSADARAVNPTSSPLLAKSPRGFARLTLYQHLRDTEEAATALFREGTRWSRTYPRFFKLDEANRRRFLLHLRIAGLFHDIGKANEDFQAAI